ncbi:hypothetical protein SUGI_0753150 [Cryptomeria japonica]|nr:hypothetical protein SUGI_0753150 [Cryptomeria japonica]
MEGVRDIKGDILICLKLKALCVVYIQVQHIFSMANVWDNSTNLLLPTSWCTWVDENSHVIHDVNGVFKLNVKELAS